MRDPNVIPCRILDQIHHLVRLTNDVVGCFGIVRIGSYANRSAHVQIQSFFLAEHAGPKIVTQTFGDHQGGVLSGLRQQNHEFISTIAEGVVNQAQLGLDEIPNFS